jgi:hypothetical protein
MDPYQELTLYQKSAALMAAAKLGLFAALANGAATPAGMAPPKWHKLYFGTLAESCFSGVSHSG